MELCSRAAGAASPPSARCAAHTAGPAQPPRLASITGALRPVSLSAPRERQPGKPSLRRSPRKKKKAIFAGSLSSSLSCRALRRAPEQAPSQAPAWRTSARTRGSRWTRRPPRRSRRPARCWSSGGSSGSGTESLPGQVRAAGDQQRSNRRVRGQAWKASSKRGPAKPS